MLRFGSWRIARNAGAVLFGRLFSFAVRLVTIKLLASFLGTSDFGIYSYVVAITEVLAALSDLGITDIGVREVTRSWNNAPQHLSSIWVLKTLLSFVALAVIAGTAFVTSANALIVKSMIVYALAVVLDYFVTSVFILFRAAEQMHYETLTVIFERTLFLVFMLAITQTQASLITVFVARLVAALLKLTMALLIAVRSRMPLPQLSSLVFDREMMYNYLKASLPLGISIFIASLYARVDIILLNFLRSPAEVGVFAGAYRVIDATQILAISLVGASFPLLSRIAKDNIDLFAGFSQKVALALLALALPGSLILSVWPQEIVPFILGQGFDESIVALRILSLGIALGYLKALFIYMLTSINKQHIYTVLAGVGLGLKVGFDLLFIPTLGYLAACIGTLATEFFVFAVSFAYIRKHVHFPSLVPMTARLALSFSLAVVAAYSLRGHSFLVGSPIITLTFLSSLSIFFWKAILDNLVPPRLGIRGQE